MSNALDGGFNHGGRCAQPGKSCRQVLVNNSSFVNRVGFGNAPPPQRQWLPTAARIDDHHQRNACFPDPLFRGGTLLLIRLFE